LTDDETATRQAQGRGLAAGGRRSTGPSSDARGGDMEGTQGQAERPADEQAEAPTEAQDLRRLAGESLRDYRARDQARVEKHTLDMQADQRSDLLRALNKAGITTGAEEVRTGPDGQPTATVDGLEFCLFLSAGWGSAMVRGKDCKACGRTTWYGVRSLVELGEALESIMKGESFYHKCEPVAPPDPAGAEATWQVIDRATEQMAQAVLIDNPDVALDAMEKVLRTLRPAREPEPVKPTNGEAALLLAIGEVVDEHLVRLHDSA
jgi:hypothetical protein